MKVDLRAALHIGLLSAATVQLFLGKFNYNLQEYLPRTQIYRIFYSNHNQNYHKKQEGKNEKYFKATTIYYHNS